MTKGKAVDRRAESTTRHKHTGTVRFFSFYFMQHRPHWPHAHAHTRKYKCSLACAARAVRVRGVQKSRAGGVCSVLYALPLESSFVVFSQRHSTAAREAGSHDSPLRSCVFNSARPPEAARVEDRLQYW